VTHQEILNWLLETDPQRLEELWVLADATRREHVGDDVHLRGLVEFSNHCVRRCGYCGLHVDADVTRYRMPAEEILGCAHHAVELEYGTVVLQSGQDHGMGIDWLTDVVRRIKAETPLAVTLSVGEWPTDVYTTWREAGADRFLLRFETSNRELYDHIHPPVGTHRSDRLEILRTLHSLGYEIGSGVMVGIPGQTYDDLASDIEVFAELGLDMIGIGPFIPHPETPLGVEESTLGDAQVPNTEEMTYRAVALTRLMCPAANIPSTTALATLNKAQGRELGLSRGANIVMPNLTPLQYRALYEIYPSKVCINETAQQCFSCMRGRITAIGRTIGSGRGDSPSWQSRQSNQETPCVPSPPKS